MGFFPVLGVAESLYFFQRKIKGSICFSIGIIFILTHMMLVGLCFQIYGLYDFFGSVIPKIFPIIMTIPFVDRIINGYLGLNINKKSNEENKDMV